MNRLSTLALVLCMCACGGEVNVLLGGDDVSATDVRVADAQGASDAADSAAPDAGVADAGSDRDAPDAVARTDAADGARDVTNGDIGDTNSDAVPSDGGSGDGDSSDATVQDAQTADALEDAGADAGSDTVEDIGLDSGGTDVGEPTGTPCTVRGEAGECLPTAACDGGRVSTPGFCPGPADIQCCTDLPPDPEPTECSEDDFPTPNAGLEELTYDAECPAGMIRVTDFCIDRFEAFVVEVLDDGSTAPWSPYFNPGERRIRARSVEGAIPQGYITGFQAEAACTEAGKRLCTNEEWLRACQGAVGNTYPYGASREPGVCNDARPRHPVVEWFGTSADWIWSRLDHPCISQQSDTVDPAGLNAGCVSDDGAFDMMGNLHEWTSDPTGTFRGGFYTDTVINGEGCLYRTTAHNRFHWDYSTGFRCCAD